MKAAIRRAPSAPAIALIAVTIAYIAIVLFVPLAFIFSKAFASGAGEFLRAVTSAEAIAAFKLTLLAAGIAVPVNLLFGLFAGWAVSKFTFPGRQLLVSVIELPLSLSPVIAGMLVLLVLGTRGFFGGILQRLGIDVVFAKPGIVIATIFVTLPYVARETIVFMQQRGNEEEEAAMSLGAGGFATFLRVTLPAIRWSVFYGATLCAARAVGEFGAVSVVSGHIRGETITTTLHIENLYNEYQFSAAFAVASILTLIAVFAILLKAIVEWRTSIDRAEAP